jgi:hypothetical protein
MLAMMTASYLLTAAAATDAIPRFDIERQCQQAIGTAGGAADVAACVRDGRAARQRIIGQWAQFSARDRSYCTELTTMTGSGTYVELLRCLELVREASKINRHESSAGYGMRLSPAPAIAGSDQSNK